MLKAEVNAIILKYIYFRFDVVGPSFLDLLSRASHLELVTFPLATVHSIRDMGNSHISL